jgi:hypothetical protein
MLVMSRVAIAILGTDEASQGACFDHRADEAEIRGRLTSHDATGGITGVGAVEAETNAAHHPSHVLLGEIRVGTTRTANDTFEARVDTAQERTAILNGWLRMQLDDLVNFHVSPFSPDGIGRHLSGGSSRRRDRRA